LASWKEEFTNHTQAFLFPEVPGTFLVVSAFCPLSSITGLGIFPDAKFRSY